MPTVSPSAWGLERAARMMLSLRRYVGGVGGFLGSKPAKVELFPVYLDAGAPGAIAASVQCYAENARGFIVGRGIPSVLSVRLERGFAKIRPAIVGALSVDVITLLKWKSAEHVEKGEPVRAVLVLKNADMDVAFWSHASGMVALLASAVINEPRKYAGFRGVVENLAKVIRRDIESFHITPFYCAGR